MAELLVSKTVSNLPAILAANTIYFVRVGVGFDIYVTNNNGTVVAYPLNQLSGSASIQSIDIDLGTTPKKSGSFQIIGTGFTANKPVIVNLAVGDGINADIGEFDSFSFSAKTIDANTIQVYWTATGSVMGNYKFNYLIGA